MSWQARIEHTPAGLALTFGAPLSRLDMAPDVAQHLASLLAVEARHRLAGVVRTLEAENSQLYVGQRLPDYCAAAAENACTSVVPTSAHPLCCDCDDCLNGDHDHGK